MAKIEDQRILIWCNLEENLQKTIVDGVYLAIKLEKEVCLFANFTHQKEHKTLSIKLSLYADMVKKDVPDCKVSTLLLKGKLPDLMKELGEKYNAILLCSGGKMSNHLLSAFYRSGFPFYFTGAKATDGSHFKKIIIPIDFRNSTKDSTLWGSYLGRFNQSEIVLLKAQEKNQEQKKQVEGIVAFVKKFYSQFFFNFWIIEGKSSSWGIHKEAINQAGDFGLVIFTGSLNVTWLDRLIGPFEKRLVNLSEKPVLLINPQKEMYVLCT
jgi:hypothetical protein